MHERFDEFYLREYPAVVGLLQGLLRSRLVAEELAQETFLVAYRDWSRVSGLDNPRAWIRKVALNQRGSFLRAYLRQQAREQRSAMPEEDDTIKLADDHAEVWQAVRTLPPSQAQVIALHYYEDYSIGQIAAALGRALREGSADQVDAATGRREIVHGARAVADDRPREPTVAGAPSPGLPTRRLFLTPQRLALVVNLLLVVILSVLLVGVARDRRQPVSTTPVATATTPPPATVIRTKVTVPEECLDAAELADEVIARLNRNQRDSKLALALTDYSVASQACRREASTP